MKGSTKEWALPWMSLTSIDRVRPPYTSPEFLTSYDTIANRKARFFRTLLIPYTYILVQPPTNKPPFVARLSGHQLITELLEGRPPGAIVLVLIQIE